MQLNNSGWHYEKKAIPSLLSGALTSLFAAKDCDYWSVTREYELGKLDVAIAILRELLESVEKTKGG
jgi:hypothetical protein